MLLVTIRRIVQSDTGTQGVATLSTGRDHFDTLEPPWRGNIDIFSCIPAGTYRAYMHKVGSGRQDRLYELHNVRERINVHIDVGAFAGDPKKGLFRDLRGAIAFGDGFAIRQPPDPSYLPQISLLGSRVATAKLVTISHGYGITIEIIDPR